MNRLKWTLLSIFLTAASATSCGKVPAAPTIKLYQAIINQRFCDANGACVVKSVCREYEGSFDDNSLKMLEDGKLVNNKDFSLVATHDIKKCHGSFGLDANGIVQMRKWARDVKSACKAK